MIFAPEYAGVCSCRIAPAPEVNTTCWPSGDQLMPPMPGCAASFVSRPSLSERIHSSVPAPPPPPPRPPRPEPVEAPLDDCAVFASTADRMNATRAPSGDGVIFVSLCGVVQTALAADPSSGTRHKSPARATINAVPSVLQNAPFRDAPASRSSRGAVLLSAGAMYTLEIPARSQTKTTDLPSGVHIGFEGCRISISCSMVRP